MNKLSKLLLAACIAISLAVVAIDSAIILHAQPAQLSPISVVSSAARSQSLTQGRSYQKLYLFNEGPSELFWALGSTATTNSIPLPPGCGYAVDVGNASNATYVSAITAASTATLRITQGDTVPQAFCVGATTGTYTFNGALTSTVPPTAVAPTASADGVSNFIAKGAAGTLFGFAVKVTASAGFVMAFDATTLPANGAVTPKLCMPVAANAGWTFSPPVPLAFLTGIVLGFSTSGCDTLAASTTAKFSAVQVQ